MPKVGLLDLFDRRYLHAVTIGVGLMVLQQFGGINGIGFYAKVIMEGKKFREIGVIAFGCIPIPITAFGFLMDNYGRKPLLLVSATGTFIGCFLTGTSFLLKSHGLVQGWVPILALSGVLIYIGSFAIGMGVIPWVILSEIFGINVKGAAGSLASMVHWLSAWAVSYTFNFLMQWSPSVMYGCGIRKASFDYVEQRWLLHHSACLPL